jgi:hypothetical protein
MASFTPFDLDQCLHRHSLLRNEHKLRCSLEASMKLAENQVSPDLSMLTTAIAHSQIVVKSRAATEQRLPSGFDDVDILILEWIVAEGRHARRRVSCIGPTSIGEWRCATPLELPDQQRRKERFYRRSIIHRFGGRQTCRGVELIAAVCAGPRMEDVMLVLVLRPFRSNQ